MAALGAIGSGLLLFNRYVSIYIYICIYTYLYISVIYIYISMYQIALSFSLYMYRTAIYIYRTAGGRRTADVTAIGSEAASASAMSSAGCGVEESHTSPMDSSFNAMVINHSLIE